MPNYLEELCKDVSSFVPFQFTSNSNKPSHVANNLFRLCLEKKSRTTDIHQWFIVNNKKKSSILNSEDLLKKYEDVFDPSTTSKDVKAFRSMLHEIFNQDNTIYPSEPFSCATSSNSFTVKGKVSAEQGIGDFIYSILKVKIDGHPSLAIKLIKEALNNNDDSISKLLVPLCRNINQEKIRDDYQFDDTRELNDYEKIIRDSFDCLSQNIEALKMNNNSILVLQRMVSLAVFCTLFYFININNINKQNGKKTPILFDSGCGLNSIIRGSHETFVLAKKNIEEFFVDKIYDCLLPSLSNNDASIMNRISDMPLDDNNNVKRNTIERLYRNNYSADNPLRSFSKALQEAIYTFEFKDCTPSEFISTCLGVRNGVIGPKGNNAIRRFFPNKFFVENLILCSVSYEDLNYGIELKQFGELLRDKYNILFGSNNDDEYEIMKKYEIHSNTPGDLLGDLHKNSQFFSETIISLGLGKKYADGVTMIGWNL